MQPQHIFTTIIKNSNLEIEETKLKLPIIPYSILMNFLCVIIIVVYVCGHCVCINLECLKLECEMMNCDNSPLFGCKISPNHNCFSYFIHVQFLF